MALQSPRRISKLKYTRRILDNLKSSIPGNLQIPAFKELLQIRILSSTATMDPNPHSVQPEAEVGSTAEIMEQVRQFFRSTIAVDNTDNHLELEDVTGSIRLLLNVEDIKVLVKGFVSSVLILCPEAQRPRTLEIFAGFMPFGLTIDEQGDIGAVLVETLQELRLDHHLSDGFFLHLPQAAELVEDMEFDSGYEVEADEPLAYDLPGWFRPVPFGINTSQPRSAPVYGPEVPGYQILNEMDDWVQDLHILLDGLHRVIVQFDNMIVDQSDTFDWHARWNAQQCLVEVMQDLQMVLLPERADLSLADIPILRPGLDNAERLLWKMLSPLFINVERYLVLSENWLITTDDKKFLAYASRYERARCRYFLRYLISHLNTPRLRGIQIPSYPQLEHIARPYEGEESCVICYEELPEEGEIATPPIVTYNCCKKPYHADCLLGWLFSKLPKEVMTCPMCRTELTLDFLGGEVMESKLLAMQVL